MKKRILVLAFALIAILALSVVIFADAQDITISYVNEQDPFSTSNTLDKGAYTDGKQIVKAGESFTLPTTSSASNVGTEGYQLIWYTENGRTYKAGETVSFTKDTRLYRCVAKEVATSDELYNGIRTSPYAVILTADIERTKQLDFHDEKQNIIVLNGHNLTFNGNIHGMGAQRTAKHVIGEGKLTLTNPDGKVNNYYVFNCKSHSYNGNRNKVTVGADVTLDAPNYMLVND